MSATCCLLEWDSQFFGLNIGRIAAHRLTAQDIPLILEWCAYQRLDCLYFLADSDHVETVEVVEAAGFGLKDIRMTYQWSISRTISRTSQLSTGFHIQPAEPADIAMLEEIAQSSYTDTRFSVDKGFDRDAAARLYRTWIRRSCEGYADRVLVLRDQEQQAVGYISCHLEQNGQGRIGLIGIAPQLRGKGFGGVLVDTCLSWFSEFSVDQVSVVTQGRNVAAQRLYQRAGFYIQNVQLWYHRWFTYS